MFIGVLVQKYTELVYRKYRRKVKAGFRTCNILDIGTTVLDTVFYGFESNSCNSKLGFGSWI